ncbi:hypothetical protein L5G28_10045 [Gordonia sp. HY285]|uniref:hypothetical protein n=1 Tax=Gordonia liuliyuniae TaxID=2911517 RepID=UPI001F3CE1CB|nr:hypothetical protein [Gordonia liuliyuniae]MCF8610494.1 hypothetical protein [Gordonia liuliyuniae]
MPCLSLQALKPSAPSTPSCTPRAPESFHSSSLNRSLGQLATSTDRVTDIADRLARDNNDLRARAARRTLIEWFNAAITRLATRQELAFQDSVIRRDDRAAAYHRGQGTAISERIRSLETNGLIGENGR